MMLRVTIVVCVFMSHLAVGARDADLITNLPGLTWSPNFKQYSGYLQATGSRKLHYWFVESELDPPGQPLVLWLNGGPGASSLMGFLTENGPFRVADDGKTLVQNPYRWNKIANMIFLEAPAGVGYSYSDDRNYTTDDDQVALNNYVALKDFMRLFPEYASNDFYITGESYGGVYVPTLSVRVMDDSSFNFKGFAVGNGITDWDLLDNSLVFFSYYHGLLGSELWDRLVRHCCRNGCGNPRECDFSNNENTECQRAVMESTEARDGLNRYNIYDECFQRPSTLSNVTVIHSHQLFQYTNNPLIQAKLKKQLEGPHVQGAPPCLDETAPTAYMNQANVREALHIPSHLPAWASEVELPYTRVHTKMYREYWKVLSTKKHRILIYNGDLDTACNAIGDEWFADALGLPVVQRRHAWHYTAEDGSSQVAGYAKSFENLVFVTVKGAGHMVPTDKPVPAYILFENFLHNHLFI